MLGNKSFLSIVIFLWIINKQLRNDLKLEFLTNSQTLKLTNL